MATKKKLEYLELHGWHWFIPLFVMPCVLLFVMFSGNSYAMTSDELDYFISQTIDILDDNDLTISSDLLSTRYDLHRDSILTYASSYDYVICRINYENVYLDFFKSDYMFWKYQNFLRIGWKDGGPPWGTGREFVLTSNILMNNVLNLTGTNTYSYTGFFSGYYYYTSSVDIYNDDRSTLYVASDYFRIDDYVPLPHNTITLTSTSNHKFGFNDFNQCVVNISGDWEFGDFTYYVERLIDNEWNRWTSLTDWYYINGYENPYYVIWHNINYFPVGTYRYCADYGNTGEQLYFSNEFQITQSVIDNSASGTIDNGNIDIDIDTGKTVDDLKDYLGSPADFDNAKITQNDIENALNIEETINPYENFVLTLINGLTSSLTGNTSTSWTFKVHSWGETFTFYPSDVIPQYSQGLRDFLTIISTTFCVIVIVRWVTQIVESVNVGDVSKSLELIEEKYSDLL